jgi:hypothetical protein
MISLSANQASVRTSTVFQGPDILNYNVPSAVGFTSIVWSPCGANWPLNIGTSVAVASNDPTTDSGFIENDTAEGRWKPRHYFCNFDLCHCCFCIGRVKSNHMSFSYIFHLTLKSLNSRSMDWHARNSVVSDY